MLATVQCTYILYPYILFVYCSSTYSYTCAAYVHSKRYCSALTQNTNKIINFVWWTLCTLQNICSWKFDIFLWKKAYFKCQTLFYWRKNVHNYRNSEGGKYAQAGPYWTINPEKWRRKVQSLNFFHQWQRQELFNNADSYTFEKISFFCPSSVTRIHKQKWFCKLCTFANTTYIRIFNWLRAVYTKWVFFL